MLKEQQMELIEKTFQSIKKKFPEAKLGEISFGNSDTWVNILVPDYLLEDDALDTLIAEKGTDILVDYDYFIQFLTMPINKIKVVA